MSDDINLETYSSIAVDDVKESYKAVSYLIELGHRRIATITGRCEDRSIGRLRLEGYYQALTDHNIAIDSNLIGYMREDIEEYSLLNGYSVMKELLGREEEFTAVYAISDILAIGACKALLDNGYKVPKDYSVMGFDGVEMARYYTPSITTIHQPIDQMANETIKTLFDLIKNKTNHIHKVFEGNLIEGQSTRKL